MVLIARQAVVRSGGRETRGPSERDMVCCVCYRFFVLNESSWAAAERKRCPHCGSRDTTPMLGEYVNAEPVLLVGPDGGYI